MNYFFDRRNGFLQDITAIDLYLKKAKRITICILSLIRCVIFAVKKKVL